MGGDGERARGHLAIAAEVEHSAHAEGADRVEVPPGQVPEVVAAVHPPPDHPPALDRRVPAEVTEVERGVERDEAGGGLEDDHGHGPDRREAV